MNFSFLTTSTSVTIKFCLINLPSKSKKLLLKRRICSSRVSSNSTWMVSVSMMTSLMPTTHFWLSTLRSTSIGHLLSIWTVNPTRLSLKAMLLLTIWPFKEITIIKRFPANDKSISVKIKIIKLKSL